MLKMISSFLYSNNWSVVVGQWGKCAANDLGQIVCPDKLFAPALTG
jgi:hypothetical protein